MGMNTCMYVMYVFLLQNYVHNFIIITKQFSFPFSFAIIIKPRIFSFPAC